jgi:hypothetical protein
MDTSADHSVVEPILVVPHCDARQLSVAALAAGAIVIKWLATSESHLAADKFHPVSGGSSVAASLPAATAVGLRPKPVARAGGQPVPSPGHNIVITGVCASLHTAMIVDTIHKNGAPAQIVGWREFGYTGSCPVRILSVDPGQRDGCKVLLRWLRNAGHLWPALGVVYLHQFRRDKPRRKQLRFRPTDLYDNLVGNERFQVRIAGVVASVQTNGLVDPGSELEIACMEMLQEESFAGASPSDARVVHTRQQVVGRSLEVLARHQRPGTPSETPPASHPHVQVQGPIPNATDAPHAVAASATLAVISAPFLQPVSDSTPVSGPFSMPASAHVSMAPSMHKSVPTMLHVAPPSCDSEPAVGQLKAVRFLAPSIHNQQQDDGRSLRPRIVTSSDKIVGVGLSMEEHKAHNVPVRAEDTAQHGDRPHPSSLTSAKSRKNRGGRKRSRARAEHQLSSAAALVVQSDDCGGAPSMSCDNSTNGGTIPDTTGYCDGNRHVAPASETTDVQVDDTPSLAVIFAAGIISLMPGFAGTVGPEDPGALFDPVICLACGSILSREQMAEHKMMMFGAGEPSSVDPVGCSRGDGCSIAVGRWVMMTPTLREIVSLVVTGVGCEFMQQQKAMLVDKLTSINHTNDLGPLHYDDRLGKSFTTMGSGPGLVQCQCGLSFTHVMHQYHVAVVQFWMAVHHAPPCENVTQHWMDTHWALMSTKWNAVADVVRCAGNTVIDIGDEPLVPEKLRTAIINLESVLDTTHPHEVRWRDNQLPAAWPLLKLLHQQRQQSPVERVSEHWTISPSPAISSRRHVPAPCDSSLAQSFVEAIVSMRTQQDAAVGAGEEVVIDPTLCLLCGTISPHSSVWSHACVVQQQPSSDDSGPEIVQLATGTVVVSNAARKVISSLICGSVVPVTIGSSTLSPQANQALKTLRKIVSDTIHDLPRLVCSLVGSSGDVSRPFSSEIAAVHDAWLQARKECVWPKVRVKFSLGRLGMRPWNLTTSSLFDCTQPNVVGWYQRLLQVVGDSVHSLDTAWTTVAQWTSNSHVLGVDKHEAVLCWSCGQLFPSDAADDHCYVSSISIGALYSMLTACRHEQLMPLNRSYDDVTASVHDGFSIISLGWTSPQRGALLSIVHDITAAFLARYGDLPVVHTMMAGGCSIVRALRSVMTVNSHGDRHIPSMAVTDLYKLWTLIRLIQGIVGDSWLFSDVRVAFETAQHRLQQSCGSGTIMDVTECAAKHRTAFAELIRALCDAVPPSLIGSPDTSEVDQSAPVLETSKQSCEENWQQQLSQILEQYRVEPPGVISALWQIFSGTVNLAQTAATPPMLCWTCGSVMAVQEVSEHIAQSALHVSLSSNGILAACSTDRIFKLTGCLMDVSKISPAIRNAFCVIATGWSLTTQHRLSSLMSNAGLAEFTARYTSYLQHFDPTFMLSGSSEHGANQWLFCSVYRQFSVWYSEVMRTKRYCPAEAIDAIHHKCFAQLTSILSQFVWFTNAEHHTVGEKPSVELDGNLLAASIDEGYNSVSSGSHLGHPEGIESIGEPIANHPIVAAVVGTSEIESSGNVDDDVSSSPCLNPPLHIVASVVAPMTLWNVSSDTSTDASNSVVSGSSVLDPVMLLSGPHHSAEDAGTVAAHVPATHQTNASMDDDAAASEPTGQWEVLGAGGGEENNDAGEGQPCLSAPVYHGAGSRDDGIVQWTAELLLQPLTAALLRQQPAEPDQVLCLGCAKVFTQSAVEEHRSIALYDNRQSADPVKDVFGCSSVGVVVPFPVATTPQLESVLCRVLLGMTIQQRDVTLRQVHELRDRYLSNDQLAPRWLDPSCLLSGFLQKPHGVWFMLVEQGDAAVSGDMEVCTACGFTASLADIHCHSLTATFAQQLFGGSLFPCATAATRPAWTMEQELTERHCGEGLQSRFARSRLARLVQGQQDHQWLDQASDTLAAAGSASRAVKMALRRYLSNAEEPGNLRALCRAVDAWLVRHQQELDIGAAGREVTESAEKSTTKLSRRLAQLLATPAAPAAPVHLFGNGAGAALRTVTTVQRHSLEPVLSLTVSPTSSPLMQPLPTASEGNAIKVTVVDELIEKLREGRSLMKSPVFSGGTGRHPAPKRAVSSTTGLHVGAVTMKHVQCCCGALVAAGQLPQHRNKARQKALTKGITAPCVTSGQAYNLPFDTFPIEDDALYKLIGEGKHEEARSLALQRFVGYSDVEKAAALRISKTGPVPKTLPAASVRPSKLRAPPLAAAPSGIAAKYRQQGKEQIARRAVSSPPKPGLATPPDVVPARESDRGMRASRRQQFVPVGDAREWFWTPIVRHCLKQTVDVATLAKIRDAFTEYSVLMTALRADFRIRGVLKGDVSEFTQPSTEVITVLVDPTIDPSALTNADAKALFDRVGHAKLPEELFGTANAFAQRWASGAASASQAGPSGLPASSQ